jgi:DNA-binding FrmR family transcriptional regulator
LQNNSKNSTYTSATRARNSTQATSPLHTPIRHGNPTAAASTQQHGPPQTRPHGQSHHRQYQQPLARPVDDNTTATFHSTASTTLNSSNHAATRFAELEASIKSNQHDFKQLNQQHETMETRLLETMSTCHENTKQLLAVQGQLNNLQSTMQVIADQMNLITHHFTTSQSDGKHETEKTHSSPVKKKARQDVLSKLTHPIIQGTLPTHDKPIQSQQPSDTAQSNHADQEEAQYITQCSPGTAPPE